MTMRVEIFNKAGLPENLCVADIATPLGEMIAVFSCKGLCLLEYNDGKNLERELKMVQYVRQSNFFYYEDDKRVQQLQFQLNLYFLKKLKIFNMPLDIIGTPFQQQIWRILQTIEYGTTISYAQQARQFGNPKAIRAVAAANGKNKISIIVPCHRVIGSNGELTGFAGGLHRKQALLALEQTQGTLDLI